jgi:predicted acylesterase/phospholipase RssA
MPLEMHVVAVDVVTGEEMRLSRGPVVEAVMASAAIPAVLPAVTWEGRRARGRRRGEQHADLARGGARRELIERAYADARELLDDGGAERPPIRMRMHGDSEP